MSYTKVLIKIQAKCCECAGNVAVTMINSKQFCCYLIYLITTNLIIQSTKHTCNDPSDDATRRTDSMNAMLCSGFL